ncbi:LysM peptidoglycan-binding domain-containing protein [Aquipseudomonas alcaligenes]
MVAIVAGNGLGLFNASLNSLGGAAGGGLGQAGGQALVNASNGNLVLRFTDEQLSAMGLDLFHTRTYNAQGGLNDGDADGWRWEGERRLVLSGTLNGAGSTLTRTTGDGHETVYAWNGSRYQSSEGDGAHDSVVWDAAASEWVWTDGSSRAVERYEGASGRLVSLTDRSGVVTRYGYDGSGRLSSVRDESSGQELVLSYNAAGKLQRLDTRTTAGGALTQQVYYGYDGLGRLVSVSTDLTPSDNSIADGKVYTTTYGYDGDSFRIASVSQSDGTTASFTYVLVGGEYRVRTVTDASGTMTFSYDTANRRTDVSNGLGQLWSYYYDAQGQVVQVQTPAVNGQRLSTSYLYDAEGNLTRVTDGLGNSVSYRYDANGNRIHERDTLGNTVTRQYDGNNQLISETRYSVPATWSGATGTWTEPPASAAQVTRYILDVNGRPRYVVSASGNVTGYLYNAAGLLVQEVSYTDAAYDLSGLTPEQAIAEATLDAWVAARNKARSTLTELAYDYRGNLSKRTSYGTVNAAGAGVIDASTVILEYTYSEHGQLLQSLATRGADRTSKTSLSSVVYDGLGRAISQVDASGTRTTVYDGANRRVAVTSSAGLTVTQSYDTTGRLLGLTQTAAGEATRETRYVYDAAGRQVMVQDPTGVRSYTFYDEAGRVSARVDGTGAVVESVYDAAGQRTQEKRYATLVDTSSWFNGTVVIKTLVGEIRPVSVAADRTSSFLYDASGRLSSSTDAKGTVTTYSYDGRSQLVRQQSGDRTLRYFYDASGRQVAQLDAEGYLRESVYDAGGRLLRTIRYGQATTEALRANDTLAELRPGAGENLESWYFYDAAGRQVGSIDEQQFVTEVVYDEASNLQRTIRYGTIYHGAAVTAATSFADVRAVAAANGVQQTTTVAYDGLGRVSQRTATDGTRTTFEYDTAGRLVREVQARGTADERTLNTRYNAFGAVIGKLLGVASTRLKEGMTEAEVTAIYAQYGLAYRYDAAGRVASVTDQEGNRTLSYYDAAGRLTHVINALGEVSETQYNAFGEASERSDFSARLASGDVSGLSGGLLGAPVKALVQAIRNAAVDNRRTYGYDTLGRLTSSTDALGYLTGYGYNAYGEQTSITRTLASGVTVSESLSYNRRGELIGRIEDVGGLARGTAIAYDAFGRVISRTDGRGLVSTLSYDSKGRRIVSRDPLNLARTVDYDAFGRVIQEIDGLGRSTTYAYDDNTRTLTVTTPDGVSISTVKDRHGQTLSVTNGLGKTTRYIYDRDGRELSVTDALERSTKRTYDAAGRLLTVTDALGRVTRYGYDAAGRVVTRTDANNVVTRYAFDGQGRQVRVTQAEGLAEQRITDYAYDRKGQTLVVTQDPNGLKLTTTYSYDGLGQQVQVARGTVASPNQQVVLYVYDKLGRRTAERLDPNGLNLTTQYRYNGNDQVTRKIDAGGNSTWYVYDNGGRLWHTVDALGGVTRTVYDAAGQITRVRRYAAPLAASVLAGYGDEVSSVSPSPTVSDAITDYVYDAAGRQRYSIDALGQVTETRHDNAGRVTDSLRYDKPIPVKPPYTEAAVAAALASAGAQARTTHSVYDDAGQLLSVTDAAGRTESYGYDAVGNRTRLTNKNGDVWTYVYDKLNRLTEEITPAVNVAGIDAGGTVSSQSRLLVTRLTYDALGNVSSRTAGRLRSSLQADPAQDDLSQARTTAYGYDAVGHQVRITSPGWYNKTTGAYQAASDGTANTFQVTTEVTYDALGNAVRNRVRVGNSGNAASDYVDSYKVYDGLGRLTHDIDALKGVTAYTYDALGNRTSTRRYANGLTAAVPAAGYYLAGDITATSLVASAAQDRTLTTRYDALGRKVSVQQDAVSLYVFNGSVAGATSLSASPTTLYSYDGLGNLVRETQVARNASGTTVLTGASTVHYYDVIGQRIGSVDALGHYTRMTYNALGQLSRQVEYATALASWNEAALPVAPTASANDRSTRYAYDGMGRVTQVTQENVRYWQQSINAQTNAVSATLVTGDLLVSQISYDGVGNTRTVTDAAGNVATTDYNALGQVSKVTEPARATARAGAVDPFASGAVIASPTTTYQVNAFGQVISETRSAGAQQAGLSQTTRTRFDAAGYEVQSIDAAGSAQSYKVDVAGRRLEESRQTSVTLSAWTVNGAALTRTQTLRRSYSYDALGQQLSTTDWYTAADNTQKSTTNSALYNRFGEVTEQRLNGNLQTRYAYDQVGRVIEQQNAQGITRVDYDLGGRASRSNQIGDAAVTTDDRITYTRYDLLGRALEQHLPAFEANLNADTLNNVNLTLATPIIRQAYDRWNNVLNRTDARGYVTTYSYDHNNKQLSETLPVTDILRENGTSYRASLIHEKRYDALGQLIQEVDLVGPYTGMPTSTELRIRQHVYNQAGELIRDIDALGYSRTYRVDAHGNRVATQDALGTVLVESYDAMDRQLTHGIIRNGAQVILQSNQYDQAGRLVGEITGATAIEETLNSIANADWSSTTTGVAGTVRYTLFDERGNIVHTRNESKIEKRYEYSEANRKTKEIDGLNNTLTWTYNEADFGRLTERKDLAGRLFNYTYSLFGQVVLEKGTDAFYTPTELFGGFYLSQSNIYDYYSNGTIKSIDYRPALAFEGDYESRISKYEYDISGKMVRELEIGKSISNLVFYINIDAASEKRFAFDEAQRLTRASSPNGTAISSYGVISNLAKMDLLQYSYDEYGNRRRSYMDTTNQSGSRAIIDSWFKYDLEGRVTIGDGYLENGKILAGKINSKEKGYINSYDILGRIKTTEKWSQTNNSNEIYSKLEHTYNSLNQIEATTSRKLTKILNADALQASLSQTEAILENTNSYDNQGNKSRQTLYTSGAASSATDYKYRGDKTQLSQFSYKIVNGEQLASQANYFAEAGMIDAVGNQRKYRYVVYNTNGSSINHTGEYSKIYSLFSSYKESYTTATWSLPGSPGISAYSYHGNGELYYIGYDTPSYEWRVFSTNREGQLTSRQERNGSTQSYIYHQGSLLATIGNASSPEINSTLNPISPEYPARTPSNYVVNSGDTLERIAQSVWGDSRMWYLIADANGLDPSKPLITGSNLSIPNVVSSTHNDASTFKPYNAAEIIGDTTPSPQLPPPPPKPKKKKCGGVASVVMVVVAVVATIFTAGAALTAVGFSGGIMATGAAAVTGGLGFSGATIGAAMLGGAVGSAASQLAGKAMGVVDSFSWKQVAVGGLTAGLTAGLGTVVNASSTLANAATSIGKASSAIGYASQGGAAYLISQVSNRIVGLETSFSWRDMAASSLSAVVAGSINSNSDLTGRIIRGQVSAHTSAWTRDKWFGGSRPDYGQVAADAFGNSLASYVVEKLKSTSSSASSESKNNAPSSSAEPSETQSGYGSDRNNPAQTSEAAARSALEQGNSKPFLSDGVEYVYRETAGRTDILLLDDTNVEASRSQTLEDLGTAFLDGIESALTTIALEIVDTPLRVVDMGIALSAVTVNLFRDEGNYWLPRTYSRMSNEYQNSGQTWDQFALEHNPLYAIPVGLGTGLGTAVAAAVAEGDYRPTANLGGAIAGGLLAGKLTSKYGGYGVSVESIGGSGFGRSQRGAINLRFVGPNTGIGKPFNETIEAPNNSKILTYGDDAEATYIIDENSSLTLQAEGVITGPHPGRKKGWLPEPVGGRLPGEHRGHLIPEGGVDNPTYVNHKYNLVSEAPKSNLGLKKTLDSLASKVAAAAPQSEVKFIAQPIRTTNTRPIATSYYVTESGILHTAMSILNR